MIAMLSLCSFFTILSYILSYKVADSNDEWTKIGACAGNARLCGCRHRAMIAFTFPRLT
jgi:hypothetical protein